jgi:hypothetical protein
VGVNKVINIPLSSPPLAWGYTPPPPRIPPYYMSECQLGGIIPYITTLKILGKNVPFFDYLFYSKTYVYEKEYLFIG